MGGDHKCPVCQATFTRPQHVARHMRSHTGDRPYKCQFCGDQFARSDLLARHVNKCHANEKPTPGTAAAATNSRRKGTASASRATTSKQACDQCVQSSLPCDGCNPCAKCVSRKCRCTYVKFHRQTAPAGPGHNPRQPTTTGHLAHLPQGALPRSGGGGPYQHQDDFLLGLGGGNPGIPFNTGAAFNFPSYGQGGQGDPQLSIDAGPADFGAKYRAQAELLRRAGAGGSPALGGYGDPQAWAGTSRARRARASCGRATATPASACTGGRGHGHGNNNSGSSNGSGNNTSNNPLENGGFSSAFGLMSIDDPDVMRGLAADSAPFFSSAAMNMAPQDPNITPMPPKDGRGGGGAPLRTPGLGREMETRELREFWKQYINQTPGTNGGEHPPPLLNTHNLAVPGGGGGLGLLSPLGGRRQRVNSLPSAKTPTAELAGFMASSKNGGGGGGGRTIHGNADDLRSYEAAVLARKAPTLSLVPRKGVRGQTSSASPPNYPASMPGGGGLGGVAHKGNYTLSRPGSSQSSTTSSLAYALDRPPRGAFAVPQAPSSRDSSDGEPASDRPSFKRLPSQTLGPLHAKRAALQGDGERDVLPATMGSISRRLNGLPGPPVGEQQQQPGIAAYAGAGGDVRDF
ncbi:hypothetical protein FIBSPDRAFT_935430 [Athelia psychrophila]|uniref:Uncharacterized protein n=1 Tax=Athelia psychrophila TaxID=1759441 RepID=A0A166DTR3_9AGAM|nr:hypothetical protein FIBSPDRAFT_935430 [Fibularhizoctonia sp. CBS 109695]